MKTTKKLFMATLMLVIAFVAVVSSTYAWFTSRQEAEVSDLNLKASTYGTDLQISLTGDDDFGYSVELAETGALLTPVTFDDSTNEFYQLFIPENESKFTYKKVEPFEPGTQESTGGVTNEGFLTFKLYFKTSRTEATNLNLDLSGIFTQITAEDNPILGTLRIMFAPFAVVDTEEVVDFESAIIYEHLKGEGGTFGTGEYYNPAKNYIAFNAFTHPSFPFLAKEINLGEDEEDPADDVFVKYILNDTFFADRIYETNETEHMDTVNNKLKLSNALTVGNTLQYRVFIWLEGWDGDTTNEAALKSFTTYLKFTN